jgi:hypothetical protein
VRSETATESRDTLPDEPCDLRCPSSFSIDAAVEAPKGALLFILLSSILIGLASLENGILLIHISRATEKYSFL